MLPAYEQMLETFYRSFLRPGDTVVDIGAHVGRHSFPCAESVGKNGKVFCFEPLPAQYKHLSGLVSEKCKDGNGSLAELKLYNLALGEDEGEAEFVSVPDFPEYSGFKTRQYHADNLRQEIIKVKVRPLDSFAAEIGNVRFIKVDAEGGELMILRGATQIISEHRPIISFELGNASLINYPYAAEDYFDFFRGQNYEIYSIFGIKLDREQFLACTESQFFWDYVAIPASQEWPASIEPIRVLVNQLSAAAEASRRLDEVLNSRSWRITSPLRLIKTVIFK